MAFLVVALIPVFTDINSYDLKEIRTWGLAILCAAIAAGVSAVWNILKEWLDAEVLKPATTQQDIISRAAKTFIQGFLAYLIMEILPVLNNINDYDFSKIESWALPIICGAFAAGLSALQNSILAKINEKQIGEKK